MIPIALFPLGYDKMLKAPVGIGTAAGNSGAATSFTITTTSAVPANGTIIVVAQTNYGASDSTTAPSSISDSVNGSYTLAGSTTSNYNANTYGGWGLWYVKAGSGLASGSTITVNITSGANAYVATAIWVQNLSSSPFDVQGTASIGGTGSGSHAVTTGTLATTKEICIGVITVINTGDATNDGSWTALPSVSQTAAAGRMCEIDWAYKIVSATTSQTYTPSTGGAGGYSVRAYAFKGI